MWKCTVSFSNWGKWKPEKQDGPVNTRWAELSLKPDKGRLERLPCVTEIRYKSDFFIFCFLKEAQWYKENAFLKGMLYLGDTIFKTFHRTSIFYNLRTKIKLKREAFLAPFSPPPHHTHSLGLAKEKRFRVCPLILHSDVLSWLVYWQIYFKNKV